MQKDGKFLKELRTKLGLTQKEFAEQSDVNLNTIMNIEQFKRKGSDETWEKIIRMMDQQKKDNKFKFSIDSEDIIEEIKNDIEKYGENHICYIFFTTTDGQTEFVDYNLKFETKIIESYFKDNVYYFEVKLKYALQLFEIQDRVL